MYFHLIVLVSIVSSAPTTTNGTELDPCDDYYDYICAKDTRVIKNLTKTTNEEVDIPVPSNFSVVSNVTLALDQIVELPRLMKWYTEIEVLFTGWHVVDYFGDMYSKVKKNHTERFKATLRRLNNLNQTCINIYYNALTANVAILKEVQPPISKRNEFLHSLFKILKTGIIQEVNATGFDKIDKETLLYEVKATHSYFAFYDFNNVTVLEKAKLKYEEEYHRLTSLLSEADLQLPVTEKILRLGAIESSMEELKKYIDLYDDRFIFQAIVANPTNDAFQYLKNSHITIITRVDPHQFEKALGDTVFVTTHEILHSIYPHGEMHLRANNTYSNAFNCTNHNMREIGKTDKVPPLSKNWYHKEVAHEDIVNTIAVRVVMKLSAERSSSVDEMKQDMETLIGAMCKQNVRKNEPIEYHNPLEMSLNNAIRQYPLFKKMYKCKKGDRMFLEDENTCKPLGRNINDEDYRPKNQTKGGLFQDLMSRAKTFNFSYGAL